MLSYEDFLESIKLICERSSEYNNNNDNSSNLNGNTPNTTHCIFSLKENHKDQGQPWFLQIEYGTTPPHFFHIIYSRTLKGPSFYIDTDYKLMAPTNTTPFHQLYNWEQHPVTNLPTRMIHQCNFPKSSSSSSSYSSLQHSYTETLSWTLRMMGMLSLTLSPFMVKHLLL